MKIYCYRSGEIGFALRQEPPGAIVIAHAPHGIAEPAVHGSARLAYDNQTWLVPGIPEAKSEEDAYQAMLRYESTLRRTIVSMRNRRVSSRTRRMVAA